MASVEITAGGAALMVWLSMAEIIQPVFFLVMTQRPPSKKKRLDKALEAYHAAYAKHKIERKNEAA